MIKHIILWRYADRLSEEERIREGQRIRDGLEGLYGRIDGLEEIHVYLNQMPTSNYDIMLECVLKDAEALQGYAVHPEHVKVKDGIIVPVTKDRVCFDFEM
ncbi:MAG: Dabb family protein [Solobacterium sp.]|nr:Dabb family protein [Solobacterium sp.]